VLKKSPFFSEWQENMRGKYLLGDSAYVGSDFSNFIITPKKDIGTLSEEDIANNLNISRGRVIIENCFGIIKCKFRRVQALQNTSTLNCVKVILGACILHNLSLNQNIECPDHPHGCPHNEI